jgi:hypothetical protein
VACRAGPEHRDYISIGHPWELVALPGEALDVISEGLTQLLPAILLVPRIAKPHVCDLEIVSEDLLEILLAIDDVSW